MTDTIENMDNIDNNIEIFNTNDFVLTQKKDDDGKIKIVSGGYKINSSFLQDGTSIMTTINKGEQNGGNVSSPFENLAVPAGLFYVNMRVPKKDFTENQQHYKPHDTISDDIIDKLYSLVEVDKKRRRQTRKHHSKTAKTKTRRLK